MKNWELWLAGKLSETASGGLAGELLDARRWQDLFALLTDFAWPVYRVRAGRAPELIQDYARSLEAWDGPEFPAEAAGKWTCRQVLRDWRNFIVDYRHHLASAQVDPAMLAWNRADHGPVVEAAQRKLESQEPAWRLFLTKRPPLCLETPEIMTVECASAYRIRAQDDGEHFLAWTDQSTVHRVSVRDGTDFVPDLPGGDDRMYGAGLPPDGSRIYLHGDHGRVLRAHEMSTGSLLWTNGETDTSNAPDSLHFSPDGSRLLVTRETGWRSGSSALILLDALTGRKLHDAVIGEGRISDAWHHPDGSRIFLLGGSGRVYAWSVQSRGVTPITDPDSSWKCVALSPDGSRLAMASNEFVRIVDCPSGEALEILDIPAGFHPLTFTRDLLRIALSDGKELAVIELPGGKAVVRFSHPERSIWSAAFSPDGSILAALCTGDSERIRFWRTDRGSTPAPVRRWHRRVQRGGRSPYCPPPVGMLLELPPAIQEHGQLLDRFVFRERDRSLWVFSNGMVCECSIDGSKCFRRQCFKDEDSEHGGIGWVAVNAAGTHMALMTNTLWFIDCESFAAPSRFTVSFIDNWNQCVSGDTLFTVEGWTGRVRRWNLREGTFESELFELGEDVTIPCLKVSCDARHLIVFDCYGLILVFDAGTGERLASTGELLRVLSVSMKGNRLLPDTTGGAAYELRKDLPWRTPPESRKPNRRQGI